MDDIVKKTLLALVASLALLGTAAAQDEEDPFAADEDPFADTADPFAALEANVSDAETSLSAASEEVAEAVAEEEEEPAAEAEPAPAAASPAAEQPPAAPAKTEDSGKGTPGFGLVAALAAIGLALVLLKRRK